MVGSVSLFYSILPPSQEWNILNFIAEAVGPFRDGSAWSETINLVILDGGNFPIVALHCCLVIKNPRNEFGNEIKLTRILYMMISLDMLNVFPQWA